MLTLHTRWRAETEYVSGDSEWYQAMAFEMGIIENEVG